ncbi:hypothetical protein ACLK19_22815 [Escherichia coli]
MGETIKSRSMLETVILVCGLVGCLLLNMVIDNTPTAVHRIRHQPHSTSLSSLQLCAVCKSFSNLFTPSSANIV